MIPRPMLALLTAALLAALPGAAPAAPGVSAAHGQTNPGSAEPQMIETADAALHAEGEDLGPPRAGLVIDYGNGTVDELCVDLDGTEITGLELLQRAQLDIRVEQVAAGAQVCRIGSVGCDAGSPCWCHCQTVGHDCTYWAYHTLVGGHWEYSRVGASSRTVRPGDVDGWAWGTGSISSGSLPPLRTFDELCPPESPNAGATPTAASPRATAPADVRP